MSSEDAKDGLLRELEALKLGSEAFLPAFMSLLRKQDVRTTIGKDTVSLIGLPSIGA